MPHHWYTYAQWVTLVLVTVLSARKGNAGERYGAGLILITNLIAFGAFAVKAQAPSQMVLFWLDFTLASGLLLIAFRYSSLWLGAAMLLQSVILFAHAMALDDGEISSFSFVLMNNLVSWLMYACLLGATLMSWRTRMRRANANRTQPSLDMACPVESSTADVRTGLSVPLRSILAL